MLICTPLLYVPPTALEEFEELKEKYREECENVSTAVWEGGRGRGITLHTSPVVSLYLASQGEG